MFSFSNRANEERSTRNGIMELAASAPDHDHDPNLIRHLMADHASLRDTLTRLEDLATHRQYLRIPGTLLRLRDDLARHIEEENTYFYAPALRSLRDDVSARERLERAHTRMAGIARLVLLFVKHYNDIYVTSLNREAFLRDLDVVASLLNDRIELEEMSLYAFYEQASGAPMRLPAMRAAG